MSIFLEIIIAFLLVAVITTVITVTKNAAMGIRCCSDKIITVIRLDGKSDSLEHTVRSLIRSSDLHGLDMEILLIADDSENIGRTAQILSRDYDEVHIVRKEELNGCFEKII